MKRYLIEREISGRVQWLESFVAGDKTFCVYLAENEDLVFEHARLGGFPVTKLTEIRTLISPMTAYSD
jgi:hypothetical protein